MALIKNPKTTEENRSARRRNGRRSQGATTAAGKERIRAANLKHGYYSKIREEALIALGEDPAELAALMAGAKQQWQPVNDEQNSMVEEMVRLRWRIRRSERLQESTAAEYVRSVEARRDEQVREVRASFVAAMEWLECLAAHAARPDFYSPPGMFRECCALFTGLIKSDGERVLALLHRLRKPQNELPAAGCESDEATGDDDWQHLLSTQEDDDFHIPHSRTPVAQGDEREGWREELRAVALEEWRSIENRLEVLAAKNQPFTNGQRDRLAGDMSPQIDLMRRQEDACYRNFFRLGNFLMKIQDRKEKQTETEVGSRDKEGGRRKETGGSREPEGRNQEEEVINSTTEAPTSGAVPASDLGLGTSDSALPPSDFGLRTSDGFTPTPDSSLLASELKNEGDSGDVDENKGGRKMVSGVKRPVRGSNEAPVLPQHVEGSGKMPEPCAPEQGHLPQRSQAAA
jgi:hypothetical protein